MVNSSRQSQYYLNIILLRFLKIFHNRNLHISIIVAFLDTLYSHGEDYSYIY